MDDIPRTSVGLGRRLKMEIDAMCSVNEGDLPFLISSWDLGVCCCCSITILRCYQGWQVRRGRTTPTPTPLLHGCVTSPRGGLFEKAWSLNSSDLPASPNKA